MMQSRFVKTPLNRRKFYTYYFLDGTTRVFHVGDNGVTAEIIKKLHSYDDAEVYNNIKNASPDPPKSEKKERKEWNNKHPEDIRNRRWNISLDAPILLSDGDYASALIDVFFMPEEHSNPSVDKMREIVATMTPRQQKVYELLYIEEFKECEVAAIMGVSTSRISAIKKRIIEILKEKFHRG